MKAAAIKLFLFSYRVFSAGSSSPGDIGTTQDLAAAANSIIFELSKELEENAKKSGRILRDFSEKHFFGIIRKARDDAFTNFSKYSNHIGQMNALDKHLQVFFLSFYDQLCKPIDKIRESFGEKKNITFASAVELYDKIHGDALAIYKQLEFVRNFQASIASWLKIEMARFNEFINENQSIHESIKIKIREHANASVDLSNEDMKTRLENKTLESLDGKHVKASVDLSNEDMKTRLENKTLKSLDGKFDKNENDYIFEFHYFRRLFYLFSRVDPNKFSDIGLYPILCSDIGPFDEPYFEKERIGASFMAFDFYRIDLTEFANLIPSSSSEFVEFFNTITSSIEEYADQFKSYFPGIEFELFY